MNIFNNTICLVTGAGSGIGKALCEQLAAKGSIVTAVDINEKSLEQTVQNIRNSGGRCTSIVFDVSDPKFSDVIYDTAKEHGRLDYIFNNAGIAICSEIQDSEFSEWREVLDVNLNGVLYGSLTAYKIMAKQGHGHIVNLSSVEGFIPFPLSASYVTSKFAVMGLSQAMWVEGRDLRVKVSVVCPGYVKTNIFDVTPMIGIDREKWLNANSKWSWFGVSPEKCVECILKGVTKSRAIIHVSMLSKLSWALQRLMPVFLLSVIAKDFRKWRYDVRQLGCIQPNYSAD